MSLSTHNDGGIYRPSIIRRCSRSTSGTFSLPLTRVCVKPRCRFCVPKICSIICCLCPCHNYTLILILLIFFSPIFLLVFISGCLFCFISYAVGRTGNFVRLKCRSFPNVQTYKACNVLTVHDNMLTVI